MLPASTVPRSVRLTRKRSSLSQGGSGRGLAAPVGPSGSFAGISLFRFQFLRVPRPALRPASVPWRVPSFGSLAASKSGSLSDIREAKLPGRPFAVPSARGLRVPPDPRGKVGSALACAAASRFFLPVARTWLPSASVRRLSRSPPGRVWERLSVSGRPLPATGRIMALDSESRQAPNPGLDLWITGISGINLD